MARCIKKWNVLRDDGYLLEVRLLNTKTIRVTSGEGTETEIPPADAIALAMALINAATQAVDRN